MTGNILVTGANGFIGSHLVEMCQTRSIPVMGAVRQKSRDKSADILPNVREVGDIGGQTDWRAALEGVETVIHLAGRAHVLKETHPNPLNGFRRVNRDGTVRLAEQMVLHGCRRLVFVSTIGVNGNTTPLDRPFTEASPAQPQRDYAAAKWEAEQALQAFQNQLEVVIVRPPLVYGAGAPGNFARLIRLVERGIPLPFGAIHNRRSLIGVQNLCDFLLRCVEHPAAAGETFLISDGADLSTTDLFKRLGARLLPFPEGALRLILPARMAEQLLDSLVVDSQKARQRLNWTPPLTVGEGFAALTVAPTRIHIQ